MAHQPKGKQLSQTTHQYVQPSPGQPVRLAKSSYTWPTGRPKQAYSVNETKPLIHRSRDGDSGSRRLQSDLDTDKQRDLTWFTNEQILYDMAIDRKEIWNWKASAQAAFERLSRDQRRRGAGLLYSDTLRDFLTSLECCGLMVVHGRDEEASANEPYSCLSAPAATIHDWLQCKEITLSLPFFCGHMMRSSGSPTGVVKKMLRTIISGIMRLKADGDHSFQDLRGRRLRDMKVSYLCTVMEYAFTQVIDIRKFADKRRDVLDVTILIDGAHLLETKDNIDDFRCFNDALMNIVQCAQNHNEEDREEKIRFNHDVIRVVLLYPNKSKYARTLVSQERMLEIGNGHVKYARQHGSFQSAADLPDLDMLGPPRRSRK